MESEAPRAGKRIDAVLGLGANLGDPERALQRALEELAALGELVGVSDLYRTLPVGGPPQPSFLNIAARLLYRGSVEELLAATHRIEHHAGRQRRERWGPRTLDIDILWMAGASVVREGLQVPHARLRERAFALCPLLDVAPDATDLADGAAYRDVLARLGTAGVVRIGWSAPVVGQMSRGMDRPGA